MSDYTRIGSSLLELEHIGFIDLGQEAPGEHEGLSASLNLGSRDLPPICVEVRRGVGEGSGYEHEISPPFSPVGPSRPEHCPPPLTAMDQGSEVDGSNLVHPTHHGPMRYGVQLPGQSSHLVMTTPREGPSLFWGAGHRLVAREPAGVGLSYGDSRTISAPIRFFKK